MSKFFIKKLRNKGNGNQELIIAKSEEGNIHVYFRLKAKWRPYNALEYFNYGETCPKYIIGIKSNSSIAKIALTSPDKYIEPSSLDLESVQEKRERKVEKKGTSKGGPITTIEDLNKPQKPNKLIRFECAICLHGLIPEEEDKDKIHCLTGCGHTFHEDCLIRIEPQLCPHCKKSFTDRDIIRIFIGWIFGFFVLAGLRQNLYIFSFGNISAFSFELVFFTCSLFANELNQNFVQNCLLHFFTGLLFEDFTVIVDEKSL